MQYNEQREDRNIRGTDNPDYGSTRNDYGKFARGEDLEAQKKTVEVVGEISKSAAAGE